MLENSKTGGNVKKNCFLEVVYIAIEDISRVHTMNFSSIPFIALSYPPLQMVHLLSNQRLERCGNWMWKINKRRGISKKAERLRNGRPKEDWVTYKTNFPRSFRVQTTLNFKYFLTKSSFLREIDDSFVFFS